MLIRAIDNTVPIAQIKLPALPENFFLIPSEWPRMNMPSHILIGFANDLFFRLNAKILKKALACPNKPAPVILPEIHAFCIHDHIRPENIPTHLHVRMILVFLLIQSRNLLNICLWQDGIYRHVQHFIEI